MSMRVIMKNLCWFFGLSWSAQIMADSLPATIPLNQNLEAVDYFREGKQTGCGLRATGESKGDVWLNVLVNVMMKESGDTFGIFKVAAKKVNMKDGAPILQDGKITYSSIGKIYNAWIRTESGVQPVFDKNGESWHSDGYMLTMEFSGTMDLLVAIPQSSFKVGFKKTKGESDEIFEFNERIGQNEVEKLFTCMRNLRSEIEEYKSKNSF